MAIIVCAAGDFHHVVRNIPDFAPHFFFDDPQSFRAADRMFDHHAHRPAPIHRVRLGFLVAARNPPPFLQVDSRGLPTLFWVSATDRESADKYSAGSIRTTIRNTFATNNSSHNSR